MGRTAGVLVDWLLVTVASMLVMALVYPDMLVSAQVRFTAGHDGAVPFQSAWLHAGYFLRGGVQLWNRLDQVNHAYLHLSLGFQGLAPIVEGWLFSLFGGAVARPGEVFQHFHPVAFFTLAALFRTAGGLALLSLYPVPRWARLLTLLLANTLLSVQTWSGVIAGFLFSLLPLVLYFLILFFRRVSLATALWVVLALGLAFAQAPLLAVGYFYLPVHFFLLSTLVAFGWWRWRGRHRDGPGAQVAAPPSGWRGTAPLLIGCAALAVVLALDLDYLHLLTRTFFIADSGLSGSQGRFDQIFAPLSYMTKPPPGPDIGDLFAHVLDFTENRWWLSWPFIGAGCLGLALIGLTHGRHRERWLYAATLLLLVLAQAPRNWTSVGLPAHLITAFTDPFAFLIAHTHMSMMLMPFFLIVPIGLGLAALWRRAGQGEAPQGEGAADGVAAMLLAAGALAALLMLPTAAAATAAAIFLALLLCLMAPRIAVLSRGPRLKRLALAVPLAAAAGDLCGYSVYLKQVPYTGDRILPRSFEGLETADGPRINPVVVDYQNPATLVFPLHLRVEPPPTTPSTDPGFPSKNAVYFYAPTYAAAFFNTVFMERQFVRPHLYEIRHIRYAQAGDYVGQPDDRPADDKAIAPLLKGDDRALFFAPVAVSAERLGPAALLAAGAARWAVSLEDPGGGAVPGTLAALPDGPPLPPQSARQQSYSLALGDAVAERRREPALAAEGSFTEYDFPLPKGFPGYMATSLFSADRRELRLFAGDRELAPAQGYLIRPFTFDVRNVATDRLVVALPPGLPAGTALRLVVRLDGFLDDVKPNRNDTTGLEVEAPADGWLVWRNPWEDGWQATLDGRPAPVYIADRTAMAVQVPAGRHKVVFAYKPKGWTRRLVEAHLVASPLLALVVLGMALTGAAAGLGLPRRAP
ncbi:membrane protein YfhO [Tistlia consotensis]|uniref:Membrane protein YfhO n=1 Tax=Tistlia consotensis USBA 355 TaxID=560819 RepID=A0A1Y6B9S5_9PROT|nr:YfhO family protein [Tistlia consotensis]SME98885.1 membrane protein YfhO [Tistlia consotensis USBA 355]SNR58349.1 membrane protein YfhO [Tistlia consotensis]